MKQNKVAFIIPGFGESSKFKKYKDIAKTFEEKDINPIILNIPWKKKVMSDYVDFFLSEYFKIEAKEVYTLGFSFGAMISFITSTKVNINTQILCSLSPYFKEDLSVIRKWWLKGVGKHRVENFHQYSYKELSSKVKAQTFLFVGAKETKEILHTDKTIFSLLNCKKSLTLVENAKHDIGDKKYLESINEIIASIG